MYVTIPSIENAQPVSGYMTRSEMLLARARLKPGTNLFREGDEVVRLYQVLSGVLRLTRLLEDGRRQVIAFGYPGDIVGFPCDGRYHTDCDAVTDVSLQPYRRAALETCESDPQLHRNLLAAALREISAMQDHFMMLGRKSAVEKVASFLCVLADRVGTDLGQFKRVSVPMSRADIADFIGLTTETVSRTLTQLRKDGIIKLENIHSVVIQQPAALLELARGDDR